MSTSVKTRDAIYVLSVTAEGTNYSPFETLHDKVHALLYVVGGLKIR